MLHLIVMDTSFILSIPFSLKSRNDLIEDTIMLKQFYVSKMISLYGLHFLPDDELLELTFILPFHNVFIIQNILSKHCYVTQN